MARTFMEPPDTNMSLDETEYGKDGEEKAI
jgi:hypothetical protein